MSLLLWIVPASVALAWIAHAALSAIDRRRFPPTGELIDVGGSRMHLHVMGNGGPSVVLDSALAGTSLSWSEIQPKIAAFTRVVSYDRVGFGWSEANGRSRTVDHMLEELRELLRKGGIEPPYILVGHSYGGWIAALYAARHPGEIAGIVLVDTPHPSAWAEPDGSQRARVERGSRLARRGALVAPFGGMRLFLRLSALGPANGNRRVRDLLAKTPASIRPKLRTFWVQSRTLEALASQIENAPASASTVLASRDSLGTIPLVVITAADPAPERLEEQLATAALSRAGRHVVAASSGHWIPLEEPHLIVDAVRELVEARG